MSSRKRFLLAIFVFLLGVTGYQQVSAQTTTVTTAPTVAVPTTTGAVVPTLYCLGSCPTPTSAETPTPVATAAPLEPDETPTDIPQLTPVIPSPTPGVLEPTPERDNGLHRRRNGGLVPRLLDIIDKLINKVPDADNGQNPTATPTASISAEPTASGELTQVPTQSPTEALTPTPGILCPDDVKMCPDGSAVGREGPNCTFTACPNPRSCVKVATWGRHGKNNKCKRFNNSCLPRAWHKDNRCPAINPTNAPTVSAGPTEVEPTEGPVPTVEATPTIEPDEDNNHEHGLLRAIINMLKKIFELIRQFFGVEVPPGGGTPTPAVTETPLPSEEPTAEPTEPPAATEAPTVAPTTAVEPTTAATVAPTTGANETPAPTSADGTPTPTTTPPATDPISQLLQILIQFLNQLIAALKGFFGQA